MTTLLSDLHETCLGNIRRTTTRVYAPDPGHRHMNVVVRRLRNALFGIKTAELGNL